MDDDGGSGGTRIAVDDTRRGTLTTQHRNSKDQGNYEISKLVQERWRRFIYASAQVANILIRKFLNLFEDGYFPRKPKTSVEFGSEVRDPKTSLLPDREPFRFPAPALDSIPTLLGARRCKKKFRAREGRELGRRRRRRKQNSGIE